MAAKASTGASAKVQGVVPHGVAPGARRWLDGFWFSLTERCNLGCPVPNSLRRQLRSTGRPMPEAVGGIGGVGEFRDLCCSFAHDEDHFASYKQ